jgi:hypothetical protein
MLQIPDVAVGALGAALVAGLLSLVGLVIAKESKTSEFRQSWIDSLRSEISKLIAHVHAVNGIWLLGELEPPPEVRRDLRNHYLGINEAAASIRMRLNPAEDDSAKFLQHMEDLQNLFNSRGVVSPKDLNDAEDKLVSCASKIQKDEWVRVKNGERVYRTATWVAGVFVLLFASYLGFSLWRGVVVEPPRTEEASGTSGALQGKLRALLIILPSA